MTHRPAPLPTRPDPVGLDATSVTRVLVGGDTHGVEKWVRTLCKHAARLGCPVVVVTGDFGWWGYRDPGFPRKVNEHASYYGVVVVFLDGNHDCHPDLADAVATFPRTPDDRFTVLTPRVWYAPRGHRWSWGGVACAALGGALSRDCVDHSGRGKHRVPGVNYFPGETLTEFDVLRLGSSPVDVLFTHDSPLGVDLPDKDPTPAVRYGTLRNRALVTEAVDATSPDVVLHGHWHYRHTSTVTTPAGHPVRVEGLHCGPEGSGHAWGVLTFPDLSFTDGHQLVADRNRGRRQVDERLSA